MDGTEAGARSWEDSPKGVPYEVSPPKRRLVFLEK